MVLLVLGLLGVPFLSIYQTITRDHPTVPGTVTIGGITIDAPRQKGPLLDGAVASVARADNVAAQQNTMLEGENTNARRLMNNPEEPGCGQTDESMASFRVLLLLSLLFVSLLMAFTLRRFKSEYLHESTGSIIMGFIVGLGVQFLSDQEELQSVVNFNQQLFFIYLLPPIIFESGYNLNKRVFFSNIISIFSFAMIGTLVSSFVFAFGVWGVGLLQIYKYDLTLSECLVFGALISATDPVTVIAIFKELKVDSNLFANVFGESVLNDAVAIVLYRTFFVFLQKGVTVDTVLSGMLNFVVIFVGSLFVGVLTALLAALLFRYTNLYRSPILETAIFILYAFSSYLIADGLELSGIVSILFCGMTMSHYVKDSLSEETTFLSVHIFEVVATMSESFVFCYLGLSLFNALGDFDFILLISSLVFLGLSRAAHVFPLSLIINVSGVMREKIPLSHQVMMWFSGLRGVIAFALALDFKTQTIHGPVILTTTLFIVLCTVLSLGTTTGVALRFLKIKTGDLKSEAESSLAEGRISTWFLEMDRRVIRPLFTRDPLPTVGAETGEHLSNEAEIEVEDDHTL